MRLIDADELRLSHCKECTLFPDECLKEKCEWGSIYHIDNAKTIEAIPIEWIEEWIDKNVPDGWEEGCAILMLEDWRKENEKYLHNEIK